MNSFPVDPDIKVHMSLDEIIRMTRGPKSNQPLGRKFKTIRRKKKSQRKGAEEMLPVEHSVPLLPSSGGVGIYVTKQSPLLSAENRRRIAQAVSNRAVNSDLIEKSKEIIPAEYKLVRTDQGVERVLVPATDYFRPRKKLRQPRKLNRITNSVDFELPKDSFPEKPPPLVAAPIFQPPLPAEDMAVDVVEPDVVVLEPPKTRTKIEVIDVESEVPVGLLSGKELSVPKSCGQTLNDRFTMLIGNFQS